MIRLLQIMLFLVASILEVEVKAALQSYPVDCLESQVQCTLKTSHHSKHLIPDGDANITMGPDTGMLRDFAKQWNVVSGQILVDSKKDYELGHLFGGLRVHGRAVVQAAGNRVIIKSLQGVIHYKGLGHADWISLTEGYEVTISKVDVSGKSGISFPKAFDMRQTLRFLGSISDLPPEQFLEEWRSIATTWRAAVAGSSRLHKHLYERELASYKATQDQEERRQESIRRERAFYKELMWKSKYDE